MARIAYDDGDAAAFAAARHLADDGLGAWRDAVARYLHPRSGMRLLDLGAGTGIWAAAFDRWFPGIRVVAVEPSEAMRARCGLPGVLAGDAADIPLLDSYPSIAQVRAAFAEHGFAAVALEPVPQTTAPSLRQAAADLRRQAHTPLQLITDEEYAAGVARLREAAEHETGPVVDALDLLVLR